MAKEWIDCRNVLWYLTFFGFAVNYMVRININIAIVDMVVPRKKSQLVAAECYSLEPTNNVTTSMMMMEEYELKNRFQWDEREQGLVLGAFFWAHWITQLPGGILAQKYGGKIVFGYSQAVASTICFFLPWAAHYDKYALILLRLLQGCIAGLSWPAMHVMTAKWIPPNERSKFVSAYLGSSVGAALTNFFSGLLIDWFNWESVFYASGVLGALWYLSWHFLAFDSPGSHPRITDKERLYIEESLGESILHKKKLPTPWKEILLSIPVWMNILAQWGGIWALFTLLTQAPTYFKYIHGWNIKMTGLLSGLPHLCRVVFALVFSFLVDYLLRSGKMSRTNVRKLATCICGIIGMGICVIILGFSGCDANVAVVFLTLACGLHGAVSSGPLASFVDLSPNFAGITLGLSGLISVIPGFISPAIVGALTLNNQTVAQWKKVYLIAGGMSLGTGILHLLFGTSELQSWNDLSTDPQTQKLNVKP